MKNTFVPLDKQSKKAQRAAVRANRALWQGVKLCPRIMRKKTDYRRKGRRVEPWTLKKVVQHPHFSV
ncbi:hypothetical protein [Gemmiger formicilis]|uniref:hypothetical protein n=1 Tax=Gemmiger formicilis TaxID=745368 RepID=UPI003A93B188